jgi:hypothetical protein
MLGLTAVRRLTRGDLRVGIANTNLAAFIYGFLRMKLDGMDGSIGEVKDKKPISSSGDGENNLSDLEGFRIKQAVPAGDVAVAPEYLRLAMMAITDDTPQVPVDLPQKYNHQTGELEFVTKKPFIQLLNPNQNITTLVKQAYSQTRFLNTEIIEDPQLLLCGFLVHDHISIRSIPYMNKSDVARLIAFCAATLWSYKQKDLAILILAIYRAPISHEMIPRAGDIRHRISKDLSETIRQLFPYTRPTRGSKTQDTDTVFSAIEQIVDMIKDRDLYYNLPISWAREVGITNGSPYNVPPNIRNILADFIIRINSVPSGSPLY